MKYEGAMQQVKPSVKVTRRRVYFVSGFDPNGPRRYSLLYRAEAAKQAKISGYEVETGPLTYDSDADAASWTVALTENGETSHAEIVMLRWDDIARSWMRKSLPATYVLMAKTFWRYTASGAFNALARLRLISTWVGMFPVAMMIVYLIAAAGLAFGAYRAATVWAGLPAVLAALLAPVVFVAAMRATRLWDNAALVYYLMCDFGFTASHSQGEADEMEARVDAFAARVHEDWAKGDCDEVLIVGHSSGAAYAASVAARVVARGADKRTGPHLSFLTLGQTIPMLSFLPGATWLRDELGALGKSDAIDWIDISSPADGGCYALADPVGVTGVAPPMAERRNPKVISARFWETVSPEMKNEIKNRWFRIHIQYLCAFDRPDDFDYFRITAGSALLADRFAARPESPRLKGAPFIQPKLRRL